MSNQTLNRRDFLKLAGLASLALPSSQVVGKIERDEVVVSPELYGGFLVRRLADGETPYQVDDSKYRRFDQKNEMFARSSWDKDWASTVKWADKAQLMNENLPGFSREDYAFYGAAWAVATGTGSAGGSVGGYNDGLYHPQAVGAFTRGIDKMPPWDWKSAGYTDLEVSNMVKMAAKFYGASLAGIAPVDKRWIYSQYYDDAYYKPGTLFRGNIQFEDSDEAYYKDNGDFVIPNSMQHVIVMAFEMDYKGHLFAGGPAAAATGNGYSKMAFSAACLAEFIRGLGYKAVPVGNSTGLSVPLAIDAGLGEQSRMGLLVTPKYGPRVRISKVFTNMPLNNDKPIRFGVTEFCEVCGKCAHNCPGGSIDAGPRTWTGKNMSNNDGVYKWYNQHENCLRYWRESGMSCSQCITVCPFNKAEGWLHDATRILIGAKSGALDKLLLNLDDASGFGILRARKDEFKDFYITDREMIHT